MARPAEPIVIGQRFSNLTILSVVRPKGEHAMATCQCDCGNVTTIRANHVLRGRQKGCGCGRAHQLAHGKAGTPIYYVYRAMRDRCEKENNPAYRHYGARGIKVCERWKKFENFYADMGDIPDGLSIERDDNDGDYEPGNCRWASKIEQMNNTRRSHKVTYRGETMTIAQVMRLSGCKMPERTVYGRVLRGFDIEIAMKHKGSLR